MPYATGGKLKLPPRLISKTELGKLPFDLIVLIEVHGL